MSAPANDITNQIRAGAVFYWNHDDRTHRIKINQGGTSSAKTYSILLVIAVRLIEKKQIATVVGRSIPDLRVGALRDWQERILEDYPALNAYIAKSNKSTLTWTFTNGSTLEFKSYDKPEKAKQGKRGIAFLNEANEIPYEVFFHMESRSDELFIDYNPAAPFWAHEKLLERDDAVRYISNWTHNPFAAPSAVASIKRMREENPEGYKVYGRGLTGEVGDLVFPNITIVPEMPAGLRHEGYGMDFGYTNSPSVMVHAGVLNERDLFLDEVNV